MFDYSAVAAMDHPTGIADEVWSLALSVGDVLDLGAGELFIDDATPSASALWIYDSEAIDLQALLGDQSADDWAAQGEMSSAGAVYEVVQPLSSLNESLLQAPE